MTSRRFITPRKRRSGYRDAHLIIIASEGTKTEKCYFDDLAIEYMNPRVHVEVLERLDTASDPIHVLEIIDDFRREYPFKKGYDELWLVIDLDHWRQRNLADVAKQCVQSGYELAVSNPCFELWLLLHLKDLDDYDSNKKNEFRKNTKKGKRNCIERELVKVLGDYNKRNPNTVYFLPYVRDAIARAQKIDIHPEHRWPNDLGSRVYLLVKRILPQ